MNTYSHSFVAAGGLEHRASLYLHGGENVILRFEELRDGARVGEPVYWGFPTLGDFRAWLNAANAFNAELEPQPSSLRDGEPAGEPRFTDVADSINLLRATDTSELEPEPGEARGRVLLVLGLRTLASSELALFLS